MPANHCTRCGAELGAGRFCTGCGHPVPVDDGSLADWRTDTAERPRVEAPVPPPAEPPSAAAPPDPARFPLFADEAEPEGPEPGQPSGPEPPPTPEPDPEPDRRAAWLPWVVVLAGMALVAGLGVFLLLADGDDARRGGHRPGRHRPGAE